MPDTPHLSENAVPQNIAEQPNAIDLSQPHENRVLEAERQRLMEAKNALATQERSLAEEKAHQTQEQGGESREIDPLAHDKHALREQEKVLTAALILYPSMKNRNDWLETTTGMAEVIVSRAAMAAKIPANEAGLTPDSLDRMLPDSNGAVALLSRALDLGSSTFTVHQYEGADPYAVFSVPEGYIEASQVLNPKVSSFVHRSRENGHLAGTWGRENSGFGGRG